MAACFSLGWLESFLIGFVLVCLAVGVVKVLIPAIMSWGGTPPPGGGAVVTILNYVLWAVIVIFVIVFFFDLLSCALGNGALPRLRP